MRKKLTPRGWGVGGWMGRTRGKFFLAGTDQLFWAHFPVAHETTQDS